MRQQGFADAHPSPGAFRIRFCPESGLPIFNQGIDLDTRGKIVRVDCPVAKDARFMDIEDKLNYQVLKRIGTVIDIGDLLRSPDRPVGRGGADIDIVTGMVLPVIFAWTAVYG